MAHYRTCWISDVHLGTHGCNAEALLNFLKAHEFDRLYLVGDIIDIWSLKRGLYWPQSHNDVVQKLLRKGRKGCELIYIPGNHDEFLAGYVGQFGNITLQDHAIHTTADGRRILIIHGHELDTVIRNMGWLAHIGDIGYTILLKVNRVFNFVRRLLGMRHWSLSAYVKNEVKNVVNFIGQFEDAVAHYASEYHVEAVLCGHIHKAADHKISNIQYYNTGDWVETCSAIVEHFDGRIELLEHLQNVPAPSEHEEFSDIPQLHPSDFVDEHVPASPRWEVDAVVK